MNSCRRDIDRVPTLALAGIEPQLSWVSDGYLDELQAASPGPRHAASSSSAHGQVPGSLGRRDVLVLQVGVIPALISTEQKRSPVLWKGGVVVTHPLWRPYLSRANADRQFHRVAHRQTAPGSLQHHQEVWSNHYAELRRLIESTVPDQVMRVVHTGSTAVAGLVAKPVIDIDVTVPSAGDEMAYVPRLEAVGFRLIFRDDLAGDPHRQFTFANPNANLHVWSPGAVEPQRHELFVGWLRDHPEDRSRYAEAKLAAADSAGGQRYNDLKSAVVYDIYERVFAADPAHHHDPQPRPDP